MLHLRLNSPYPPLSYLNQCQSSLLSLSRSRLCFLNFFRCALSLSVRSLCSFPNAQQRSNLVYLNLADILGARSMTLIQVLSRKLKAAARQGPAVTVIPVFSPTNPSLRSSLFVFYHYTSLLSLPFFTVVLKILQLVIVRKRSSFMQTQQRRARSVAVERASWLGSPCGLANLVFLKSRHFASLFISPINAFCSALWSSSLSPRSPPPQQASSFAASFPLGSMSPYNSSQMEYYSPSIKSASVPVMLATLCDTLTIVDLMSMLRSRTRLATVQKVIILVRLAISRDTRDR